MANNNKVNKCAICDKKLKGTIQCVSCEKFFHSYCITRSPNCQITDKNKILCAQCSHHEDLTSDEKLLFYMKNNGLLSTLVMELQEKNDLLREKIEYLERKLQNAEKSITEKVAPRPKTADETHNIQEAGSVIQNKPVEGSGTTSKLNSYSKVLTSQNSKQNKREYIAQQDNKKGSNETPNHFITKEQVNQAVSTALAAQMGPFNNNASPALVANSCNQAFNPNSGLVGVAPVAPKKWLYINRVAKDANCDSVTNYIISKNIIPSGTEIVVQQLRTNNDSSSFKLGVDPAYAQALKEKTFWPEHIMVKDFIFRNSFSTGRLNSQQNYQKNFLGYRRRPINRS